MTDNADKRPDVAKDDAPKTPRREVSQSWSNATETMDEAPAGAPDATKQSRTSS